MSICWAISSRILRQRSVVAGPAAEHVRQGVDRVGVGPVVVDGVGRRAADRLPGGPTSTPRRGRWPGRPRAGRRRPRSGRNAQGRHAARKAWCGTGDGGKDLLRPAAALRAPGAVGVLPDQQELDAAVDRRADCLGRRRRDGLGLRTGHGQRGPEARGRSRSATDSPGTTKHEITNLKSQTNPKCQIPGRGGRGFGPCLFESFGFV